MVGATLADGWGNVAPTVGIWLADCHCGCASWVTAMYTNIDDATVCINVLHIGFLNVKKTFHATVSADKNQEEWLVVWIIVVVTCPTGSGSRMCRKREI
ncbi:hypothetical protein LSAT2_024455 [Lamellibrachia satsuma]|nr:hypothetical protein LSAT2_024455 [Lamellibrachia satsuma]